jgi:transposase
MSKKPNFKPYNQGQTQLFPTDIGSLIPANHPVRFLSSIVDELDLTELYATYSKEGASRFHPRMMIKVWIYGYLENIYSSRKLEQSLKENIYMMWLSGMQQPDHNTLNRFRSGKLKPHIKTIFSRIVLYLVDMGELDLSVAFTDGTKLESSANKYSFVWRKRIQQSKDRIEKRLEELWSYAEKHAIEELKDKKPASFKPVSSAQVRSLAKQIGSALKDVPVKKKSNNSLGI